MDIEEQGSMVQDEAEGGMLVDEEELLDTVGGALQEMGFDPQLTDCGDGTLSLEAEIPAEWGNNMAMSMVFIPMEQIVGDRLQLLQVYIKAADMPQDLTEAQLGELCRVCNFCSLHSAAGTFGVQSSYGYICCKQGITLRGVYGLRDNASAVMDTFILMLTFVNRFCEALARACKGETLEQLQADGLLPGD